LPFTTRGIILTRSTTIVSTSIITSSTNILLPPLPPLPSLPPLPPSPPLPPLPLASLPPTTYPIIPPYSILKSIIITLLIANILILILILLIEIYNKNNNCGLLYLLKEARSL
jgi:hypothetical protein